MTLSSGDEATIIGVGVALVIALGAAIFKAASFRGDVNTRWRRRVDFAVTALDEKGISELERLRDAIDEVLPSNFDPSQAIADPAPLNARAETVVSFYRTRVRMEACLKRLIWIGPALVGSLIAVLVATVGLTLYFSEVAHWDALRVISLLVGGLALVVLVATVAAYIVWQHQLSGGEILAGTAGKADREQS